MADNCQQVSAAWFKKNERDQLMLGRFGLCYELVEGILLSSMDGFIPNHKSTK